MNSLSVQFLQRVLQTAGSHQFFQTCEESTKCGHVAQSERLFDLNIYLLNANTAHYGQFAYNVEHKFYELRSQHRPFRDALRRTKRGAEIRKFEKMLRRNCFRISDFSNECFITDDALVRRSERAFVTVDALRVGIISGTLRFEQAKEVMCSYYHFLDKSYFRTDLIVPTLKLGYIRLSYLQLLPTFQDDLLRTLLQGLLILHKCC